MDNRSRLVSVIIPVYNVEKCLRRCVDSVLNQTYENIEVILVDDGSPDGCPKICDEYREKDSRIVVIHKENGGPASARNVGLSIFNGEFCLFVDSDDWVEEDYIEILVDKMIKKNPDIIVFGYKEDYEEGGWSSEKLSMVEMSELEYKHSEIVEFLAKEGMINTPWSKMYSRDILLTPEALFFEEKSEPIEDILFNQKVFSKKPSILVTDFAPYHYVRIGGETMITKYRSNMEELVDRRLSAFEKIYHDSEMEESVSKALLLDEFRGGRLGCIINSYKKESPDNFRDRNALIRKMLKSESFMQTRSKRSYSTPSKLCRMMIAFSYFPTSLINIFYCILFFARFNFEGLYEKFRRRLVSNG